MASSRRQTTLISEATQFSQCNTVGKLLAELILNSFPTDVANHQELTNIAFRVKYKIDVPYHEIYN